MMRNRQIILAVLAAVLALLAWGRPDAAAQIQQEEWSSPFRISSDRGSATEATLLTDPYGFVHAFWIEVMDEGSVPLIMYARFDGVNWTTPNDIYMGTPLGAIRNVTAALDRHDQLHIAWTEGTSGPVFYSQAPLHDAQSAHHWSRRYRIDIQSGAVLLQVDSQDTLHLLYSRNEGDEMGLYYTRSSDAGISWTPPLWLDPDIPADLQPGWFKFVMDERDGLHAVWGYLSMDGGFGDWIRYAHSLDRGETWSTPFTIDRLDEARLAAEEKLSFANPVLAVHGDEAHILWAGGLLHYRHHRYSTDRGRTWSQPRQVFGSLNGQAGDGLIADATGRFHFFSQIRFPQGIYHAVWDGNNWSSPELVYLVSLGDGDTFGDRIHAHRTFPIIRADNQLILTFTDPPPVDGRRLFYIQRTLDDIAPAEVIPTPSPTPPPTPEASPTPTPTVAAPPAVFNTPPAAMQRVDYGVWVGLVPMLLLAGTAVLYQFVFRRLRS